MNKNWGCIEFKFNSQSEFFADYQGLIITQFTFEQTGIENDSLLDGFIDSRSFVLDSLASTIKKAGENSKYLGQAFNRAYLGSRDFKKLERQGIADFLNRYWEEDVDPEGKSYFATLRNNFFPILENTSTDDFYLIDIDWFDKNDLRLYEHEAICYTYYFLIIWIDQNKKELFISEWFHE